MDSHEAIAVLILNINAVHGLNDITNGSAGRWEFVAQHVNTDFLARVIKGANGIGNTLYGAGVTKGVPCPQPLQDCLPASRCIRNPVSPKTGKQVFAHIVEYLDSLTSG